MYFHTNGLYNFHRISTAFSIKNYIHLVIVEHLKYQVEKYYSALSFKEEFSGKEIELLKLELNELKTKKIFEEEVLKL